MKKPRFRTSGIRQTVGINYREFITKKEPEKALTFGVTRKAGRMGSGGISTRHKGGGHKQKMRIIDFKQNKFDMEARVIAIEYDPMRTAFIALLQYKDGERRYILAPKDLKVGDMAISSENAEVKVGNRVPLKKIPVGYFVHNVEFFPGKGGQLIRSAGSGAQIMATDGGFVNLLMPSKEIRKIPEDCFASVGTVSNAQHNLVIIGKAGRSRHMGRRPATRGSVMNPVDHPHGGGEGKQGIGLKYPKTPWGKPALGVKTRRSRKESDQYIVRRRIK